MLADVPAPVIDDPRNVWTPDSAVRDHLGGVPIANRVYFVPPPTEIGRVLTARSTLHAGKAPFGMLGRSILIAAAVAVPIGIYILAKRPGRPIEDDIWLYVIAATIVGGVAWYFTRFRQHCEYIGDMGIARYTWHGRPQSSPRLAMLQFKDAVNLRTKQTRHYVNRVYTGTEYEFIWMNSNGRSLHKLSGRFRSSEGRPKRDDPFWYARMAEVSWNALMARAMQTELEANGFVRFNINSNDSILIGPGFMEFHFLGHDPQRLEPKDIAKVSISQGTFTIKTHDARWFRRKGTYTFAYAQLDNAQMFLRALEMLMGYRFN